MGVFDVMREKELQEYIKVFEEELHKYWREIVTGLLTTYATIISGCYTVPREVDQTEPQKVIIEHRREYEPGEILERKARRELLEEEVRLLREKREKELYKDLLDTLDKMAK